MSKWRILGLLACLAGPLVAGAQQAAHQHGTVLLDVAVDASTLSLRLEAPLDSLLGFERAPRSDAERKAADTMRAQLGQAATMFGLDAAAGCVLQPPQISAPALEPGAKADEHAELVASYLFRCRQPGVLRVADLNGLLIAFPRIQRVEVQVAAPGGQWKQVLKRPQAMVKLVR
ncbi:MAG: DUF2796 domain-containing protein [Burkholderiales bacterium]|nr:DUF2796 domain-containing protein [Burkholderiales bacterium]